MSECENNQCDQPPKKASPASKRPALAIYRPPGTRNSTEKATPDTNGVGLKTGYSTPPPCTLNKGKEMSDKKNQQKKKEHNNKQSKNADKKEQNVKPKKEENNNNMNESIIKHIKSKSINIPKTQHNKNNQNGMAKNKKSQVDCQPHFNQQRRSKSRDCIKIGQFGNQNATKNDSSQKSREAPAAFLRATPILGRKTYENGHMVNFSRPLNPEAEPFVPLALRQSMSPPFTKKLNDKVSENFLSTPARTSSAPLTIGKSSVVRLDWTEARNILLKLDLPALTPFLGENGLRLKDQSKAEDAAHNLIHKVVEGSRATYNSKDVARAFASFLERCDANNPIHNAIGAELWQYFDCRDSMRTKKFRNWLSFVTFTADVYSATGLGYDHETIVKVMLRTFDYMLHEPVLDSLRIEELEAIISALLSCGYDLERQCPDDLAILKDSIRDAFVLAREPWARKMILLLVELAASGWRLPAEANEYYFEVTNGV